LIRDSRGQTLDPAVMQAARTAQIIVYRRLLVGKDGHRGQAGLGVDLVRRDVAEGGERKRPLAQDPAGLLRWRLQIDI
jgi:hypothetical protein